MNREAAHKLIAAQMAILRSRGYESLRDEFLDRPRVTVGVDADGEQYELEIEAFWDDRPGGDLRVMVSLFTGGFWRRISPFTEDFIISPRGQFVGE